MHIVKSTYKILSDQALQNQSLEALRDWALEMMEAGFETEHLILLAGLPPNINRFQFDDIFYKALKELSLDTMSEEEIIYGYVYYLIDQAYSSG